MKGQTRETPLLHNTILFNLIINNDINQLIKTSHYENI